MVAPEVVIPSEDEMEELESAFEEVIDDFDNFMICHNVFREHIRDVSPSSHAVNKYRLACQLMSPMLVAVISIRDGATDGVCRDNILTHALERVILHMDRPTR